MERYKDIADDLIVAIERSDLPVQEISKLSGVPATTIFGWLNCGKTPSIRNAFYVFSALGYKITVRRDAE